jgi:hypothetical protein
MGVNPTPHLVTLPLDMDGFPDTLIVIESISGVDFTGV